MSCGEHRRGCNGYGTSKCIWPWRVDEGMLGVGAEGQGSLCCSCHSCLSKRPPVKEAPCGPWPVCCPGSETAADAGRGVEMRLCCQSLRCHQPHTAPHAHPRRYKDARSSLLDAPTSQGHHMRLHPKHQQAAGSSSSRSRRSRSSNAGGRVGLSQRLLRPRLHMAERAAVAAKEEGLSAEMPEAGAQGGRLWGARVLAVGVSCVAWPRRGKQGSKGMGAWTCGWGLRGEAREEG